MILHREQIEYHSEFILSNIYVSPLEDILWIDSITDEGNWRYGVKAWVIKYTYCTKTHKLLEGIRIVDTHNSLKTYKLLSDVIQSVLREEKLNSIGI